MQVYYDNISLLHELLCLNIGLVTQKDDAVVLDCNDDISFNWRCGVFSSCENESIAEDGCGACHGEIEAFAGHKYAPQDNTEKKKQS